MNHEKIPDPTADRAIYNADKQRRLEKLHNVKVGEEVYITKTVIEDERGKKKNKTICVKVAGVYEHCIQLLMPGGHYESPCWWEFERKRINNSRQRR